MRSLFVAVMVVGGVASPGVHAGDAKIASLMVRKVKSI
jgi:hypothetical protein